MKHDNTNANRNAGVVAIAVCLVNVFNMYLLAHDNEYSRWMDRMADKASNKIVHIFKKH